MPGFRCLRRLLAVLLVVSAGGRAEPAGLERGVGMLRWKGAVLRGPTGEMERHRTTSLELGVYLPDEERFVRLAPELAGATHALVDLAHRQLLVVHVGRDECGGDFCPRIRSLDLLRHSLPSPLAPVGPEPFERVSVKLGFGRTATLVATEGGAWLGFADTEQGGGTHWLPLGNPAPRAPALQGQLTLHFGYQESGDWALLEGSSDLGLRLRGGAVYRPGLTPLLLPPGHRALPEVSGLVRHQLLRSPDGTLLVATNHLGCRCGADGSIAGVCWSALDSVSSAGEVRRLSRGVGLSALALGGDGSLYQQRGRRVWRDGKRLAEGLLLVTPAWEPSGCCGL